LEVVALAAGGQSQNEREMKCMKVTRRTDEGGGLGEDVVKRARARLHTKHVQN
jgi:hypothetical protein